MSGSYEAVTFSGGTAATTVYVVEEDSGGVVLAIYASETVTTGTFVSGGLITGAGYYGITAVVPVPASGDSIVLVDQATALAWMSHTRAG
jgi:hypothetical protein